jgi:hypothetical protein
MGRVPTGGGSGTRRRASLPVAFDQYRGRIAYQSESAACPRAGRVSVFQERFQ